MPNFISVPCDARTDKLYINPDTVVSFKACEPDTYGSYWVIVVDFIARDSVMYKFNRESDWQEVINNLLK